MLNEFELKEQMLLSQQQTELLQLEREILILRISLLEKDNNSFISCCLKQQISLLEQAKAYLLSKHGHQCEALKMQKMHEIDLISDRIPYNA